LAHDLKTKTFGLGLIRICGNRPSAYWIITKKSTITFESQSEKAKEEIILESDPCSELNVVVQILLKTGPPLGKQLQRQ